MMRHRANSRCRRLVFEWLEPKTVLSASFDAAAAFSFSESVPVDVNGKEALAVIGEAADLQAALEHTGLQSLFTTEDSNGQAGSPTEDVPTLGFPPLSPPGTTAATTFRYTAPTAHDIQSNVSGSPKQTTLIRPFERQELLSLVADLRLVARNGEMQDSSSAAKSSEGLEVETLHGRFRTDKQVNERPNHLRELSEASGAMTPLLARLAVEIGE